MVLYRITPAIYHSVLLEDNQGTLEFLEDTVRSSSEFRAVHMRSVIRLVLPKYCSSSAAAEIISACPCISSITYCNPWPLIIPPSLTRICTNFPSSMLALHSQNLTRMELTNAFPSWPDFTHFAALLPRLTHLSLNLAKQSPKALHLGWECIEPYLPPSTRIVILFLLTEIRTDKSSLVSALKGEMDKRLVVGIQFPCGELVDAAGGWFIDEPLYERIHRWKMDGVETEDDDHWVRAEKIVQLREKERDIVIGMSALVYSCHH